MAMKVLAAQRLAEASRIVKNGYSEEQGLKELTRLTDYKKKHPHSCELLGAKGELRFYKFVGGPYGGADVVCTVDNQAVGTVHLSRRHIDIETDKGTEELICVEPSSFIAKTHRGQGIMFGMYQWVISKYNLIADEEQTRASFDLWKRLSKMYDTQILSRTHAYKRIYRVDPKAKPTLKSTLMLIRRHA